MANLYAPESVAIDPAQEAIRFSEGTDAVFLGFIKSAWPILVIVLFSAIGASLVVAKKGKQGDASGAEPEAGKKGK